MMQIYDGFSVKTYPKKGNFYFHSHLNLCNELKLEHAHMLL
jgi:hypothetical protein